MTNQVSQFVRVIVSVYAVCFALGALSHGKDFLIYGWRPYTIAPPAIEVFWSSLIVIDLLVVVILMTRQKRLGSLLALAIMLVDVGINTYATIFLGFDLLVGPLVLQAVFLGFIIGTIGFVLRR